MKIMFNKTDNAILRFLEYDYFGYFYCALHCNYAITRAVGWSGGSRETRKLELIYIICKTFQIKINNVFPSNTVEIN